MVIRIGDILNLADKELSADFVGRLSNEERELLCNIITKHYCDNVSWFVSHNAGEVYISKGLSLCMKDKYKRRLKFLIGCK